MMYFKAVRCQKNFLHNALLQKTVDQTKWKKAVIDYWWKNLYTWCKTDPDVDAGKDDAD